MISLLKKKYYPLIKIWDGTTVHESIDSVVGSDVASKLSLLGLKTLYKGLWSFEDLHNGKKAYVTHTRRVGSQNPFGISKSDSEKFLINIAKGLFPKELCMQVAAHGHTMRGIIDDEPFRIINSPCWATFQEYPKACANFAHYQTDIGAVFIIVTKDGRIRIQPWLYPYFIYNCYENTNYEANTDEQTRFVDTTVNPKLENYFRALCKDSKFIVAVTADLHCGDRASVAPPKFSLGDVEYNVNLSVANYRLWCYWQHFVKACKLIKPNELWIVGDIVQGTQMSFDKVRRGLTFNLEEQKAMFIELMKEFLK